MGILDFCPHLKQIVQKYTHLEWAEIDEILVSLDEPWKSTIYYKVEKDDGSTVYAIAQDNTGLYEKLLDHLIQCNETDEKTKQWAIEKKKEINEKWNEFINNRWFFLFSQFFSCFRFYFYPYSFTSLSLV